MLVESLESISLNGPILADICLIGGGPASLTLASELRNEKIRLVIIESGGLETEAEADALSEIESVGFPRTTDQTKVRNRVFGGSSHTWSGRCAMLDPVDLKYRPWVPLSGWPMSADQLEPLAVRACPYLGLQPFCQGAEIWPQLGLSRPEPDFDDKKLSPFFWQFSRDEKRPSDYMRFGPRFLKQAQDNCRIIYHATVTHVDTTRDGSAVQGVELADRGDRRVKVISPLVVLAAGGIENPRLLLASRRVVPAGIGNGRDLVGRYLMDHPRGTVAYFDMDNIAALRGVRDRYGRYRLRATGREVVQGIALSWKVQQDEELLQCAAYLTEEKSADNPWDGVRRLLKPGPEGRRFEDLLTVVREPGILMDGARQILQRRRVLHKLDGLFLKVDVEQVPDANSRVTLTDRRDRFGVPLPRIDWQIGERECRSVVRLIELIAEEFPHLGLPAPHPVRWVKERDYRSAEFYDSAHPSGTTRMAESPAEGVVDAHSQVHGVEGLYVTGGSIFPTNGHANSTMMIVAMAIRLADRLRWRLQSPVAELASTSMPAVVSVAERSTQPMPSTDSTILVTGGTGNIGSHLLRTLEEGNYRVRALTSRPPRPEGSSVEWRQMDWRTSLDFDRHVEGCSAVLHLGVAKDDIETMHRVNVEATGALAEAADRAGVKYFCYLSSISAYGSPLTRLVDETSPMVNPDQDVGSENWTSPPMRAYARNKVASERLLAEKGHSFRCVILRPTIVRSAEDIRALGDWTLQRRFLAAGRLAHTVAMEDVVHSILWFWKDTLARKNSRAGVETYNVADDHPEDTYAAFFKTAFILTRDPRYRCPPHAPAIVERWINWYKYRTLDSRWPLGLVSYSSEKLFGTGYRHVLGASEAYRRALEKEKQG
jgi:choline dehydrogenase-like flavoprotein/nucleoside-diphosphate-sugar epimerase